MVIANSRRSEGRDDPAAEVADREGRLDGKRKAAVLILALDEDAASELLASLTDEELEDLTAEIARLGMVEHDVLSSVLLEFHDLTGIHGILKGGGIDQAIRLVERSFPQERSRRLVQMLDSQRRHVPLAFLSRAETEGILSFLRDEQPQTVAAVLAHMTPSKAAELLERMDEAERVEVVQRIASLQGTHDEALRQLEKNLRERVDATERQSSSQRNGVQTAADILKAAGRRGRDLLNDLRQEKPELGGEIQRRLVSFDDLIDLEESSILRLYEEVDTNTLATALKLAAAPLREKVLQSLPRRESQRLEEAEKRLGAVRAADADAARQEVVAALLALEEGGEVLAQDLWSGEESLA